VNTRERLEAARAAGVISQTGAHDLIDAYDLIAETRLRHQAAQIRAGAVPDNFMAPGLLSELERNHLRDAFMVIKAMQSAVSQGRGIMG
jgi:CBS domain-containing protein